MEQLFTVVIPAAGVGQRMQAQCPKQYLEINQQSIISHTVERLLSHPSIKQVVIVLGVDDQYFPETKLAQHPKVKTAIGGKERVDSVLAGLLTLNIEQDPWVLVHDAARPCVKHKDISQLIEQCCSKQIGGLLATPVSDTIKVSDHQQKVQTTADRSQLWRALTPQMYKTSELINAIEHGLKQSFAITDESSAIEQYGLSSQLVSASSDNIKITHPDDLSLASFILTQQQEQQCV